MITFFYGSSAVALAATLLAITRAHPVHALLYLIVSLLGVAGMMLALGRRFREGQAGVARGSWSIPLGTDLYRKTVGVIGLGCTGDCIEL